MSAMTLEQVRERLQSLFDAGPDVSVRAFALAQWIEGVDAHLTAHAQMVEKVREVIASLESVVRLSDVDTALHGTCASTADKLSRAIGDTPTDRRTPEKAE